MKHLNNRITAVSLLIFTAIVYLGLSLTVNMPLKDITHNIWNGYYTLALEADAPVVSLVDELKKNSEWEILSEYNSMIQVFNYDESLFIPVSELKNFYVDGDPLYDPFLKKLPLLFTGKILSENYHVVYIKSNLSSTDFSRKMNKIMKNYPYTWVLPEIKLVQESISILFFIFAIILLLIWHKELWPILVPGIFPWFQFASSSGLPGVLVSIIFLFSLVLLGSLLYRSFKHYLNLGVFDPINKKKLILSVLIMIFSVIYLLLNLKTLPYLAAYFIAFFAHLFSIVFYIIILDYKRKLQQHRMFFPVIIKFNVRKIIRSDIYSFCSLILIIFLSPLLIHENRFESNIKLPVPVAIEGVKDFSRSSLQILDKHSIQSELPNLSDYISHMKFLETYSYGFNYSFPEPEQILSVPLFSMVKGDVKEKNVNIFMFTDAWYESIMDSGLSSDILSMLISQGSPVLVAYQSEFGDLLAGDYLRNHYWFSIFLAAALLFWLSNLSLSGWYILKEFLLRRKQQAV
ncbi:MAG: hypothetical protein KAH95_13875 [Spirochaetales bacterium]|nr:hypothetical protein [Spirochaetales bacterium]